MSLLAANNLAKSFGSVDLFAGVSFSVPQRARIGLVGPNGVGKTTLFRVLLGLEDASAGSVTRARGVRLGYLPQNATLEGERTVWEECKEVFRSLIMLQQRLSELEHDMGALTDEAALEAALDSYGRMQAEFEHLNGYTYENRMRQTLEGLGFLPEDFSRPLWQLSGGQRTRAFLAKLLLSNPDVLLLDEPTNHLDIAATEWLESHLRDWPGAVILISHDRYFLDQVVSTILEMTPQMALYNGNYSAYLQQREARWERLQELFEAGKARFLKDMDYIKRNISGQNVRQARGRLKRLSRELEAVEQMGFEAIQGKNWSEIAEDADISESTMGVEEAEQRLNSLRLPANRPPQLKLHLKTAARSGDLVLRTHNLDVGYADEGKPLFTAPDITLVRGECAGVIGPNGAGKSTFLKTLLGQLPPLKGDVTLGANLQIGYFAQAHEGLHADWTLMQEIETAAPNMRLGEIRDYLAKFLFSGDDVFKRVEVLSGGERGRLALACLALTQANLLLLDEPTNHLDLPSQEVLQSVLSDYAGTILLVSHDRYLVDALSTQIWELDPAVGSLRVFVGSYSDYRAARQMELEAQKLQETEQKTLQSANKKDEALRSPEPAFAAARTASGRPSNNRERERLRQVEQLETEIAQLETDLAAVSHRLESPPSDAGAVVRLSQEYERLQHRLDERMQDWAQLSD